MKKRIMLAALSVFLAITMMATPALAKDPDKDEGAQGVPFEDLRDAIDSVYTELQAQIEQAVTDLQEEIAGIEADVHDDIVTAVADLRAEIVAMIEGMQAQIDGINGQLAVLQDEISNISVGWDDINDMPAGFADGTDDVGLTVEEDPTVPASVKDGISWEEISNMPYDIADGDGDTQLTETEVDAYVANNGYLTGYTETDPVYGVSVASSITATDIAKWNTVSGGGTGDGHSLDAADGDPIDAVYVDNEGNVGVGTTSPSGIFEVQGTIVTSATAQLDQAQQSRDGVYSWTTHWQSFTAGITGELTRIEVYVVSPPDDLEVIPGKLLIYVGEGLSGSPTREQAVGIEQEGYLGHWQAIELNNPLPVQKGEKYTWCIKSTTTKYIRLKRSYEDSYPGGRANLTSWDYAFRTYVAPYLPSNLIFTDDGNLGIGTEDPGDYRLYVEGSAYASGGWQAPGGDYAEWFEKEEEAAPGDVIGINLETGKARKYRPGDWFIGVCSTNAAYVGNSLNETDEQMAETHILVGLLGQMDFNEEQVAIEERIVKTTDGVEIGILLSNGKVFIGR